MVICASFCPIVDASILLEEVNYKNSLREAYGSDYEEYLKNNQMQVSIAEKVDALLKENYYNNYPDFYGGMYISDDSLNLIVQIVKNVILNEKDFEVIEKISSLDKGVIIDYVDNSYNKLIEYNDYIGNYIKNSNANEIQSNYIDIINNKIVLEIDDVYNENTKKRVTGMLLKKKINNEIIKYKEAANMNLDATLKSGAKYQVVGWYCSTGFRTKYNGKNGIVTAGHCLDRVGADTQIGTIRLIQFKNNESFDYGFIETESSYSLSNDLAYPYSGYKKLAPPSSTTSPLIVVNMAIAKSGYKTGYTAGKVTSINTGGQTVGDPNDSNNVQTIYGLINANYSSATGDSGAPVFIPKSDLNGSTLIGIHSASTSGKAAFTSINDLPSSLTSGRY